MNALVLGGGAREHGLVLLCQKSPEFRQGKIHCIPGNAGIAKIATCAAIDLNDHDVLVAYAKEHEIDFVLVGPEDPLAKGIVDRFMEEGILIYGPTAAMAMLESSKAYAKTKMQQWGIPTAPFDICYDMDQVRAAVDKRPVGCAVIKGDGLAAGKGVEVSKTRAEAIKFAKLLFTGERLGEHKCIIVEDKLVGDEASVMLIASGEDYVLFDPSQDNKPIFDGDEGPNTGGMGSDSPTPFVPPEIMEQVEREIIKPLLAGMMDEVPGGYQGTIYLGLMITESGPSNLEINVRFGDPECLSLFPRLITDLIPIFIQVANGQLETEEILFDPCKCVTVVIASTGYPASKEVGVPIYGIEAAAETPGVTIYHAGTKVVDGELQTAGGRVLDVSALGFDLQDAIERAYHAVELIKIEGMQIRSDIGEKALKKLRQIYEAQ